MKITVDISEDDLREIQRHSGEQKKGPAIQKFIADKLKLAHRLEISRKFLTGEWERSISSRLWSRAFATS